MPHVISFSTRGPAKLLVLKSPFYRWGSRPRAAEYFDQGAVAAKWQNQELASAAPRLGSNPGGSNRSRFWNACVVYQALPKEL